MIIGVDRLDYSKGIGMRMRAFEQFLADYPRWRGDVTYLQITPRSRSDIREYADMERRIDETVGRINGHYGEAAWTPIRYVKRPYSRSALAGLYRSSRAALVTPLRDGMNLVAKEYVAAQDPEDPGVLILSRFAGAAVECEAALLVNPYDQEAVAAAIDQALSMPLEERKARHGSLVKVLSENDIKYWGTRFIAALMRPAPVGSGAESSRRRASPCRSRMIGALLGGLRRARQVECAVDQRHMRECLRKIAEQLARGGIVFLAQQADIVAERDQPLEQGVCVVEPAEHHIGIDQPEAARQERAFARRQPVVRARGVVAQHQTADHQAGARSPRPCRSRADLPAAGSRPPAAAAGSHRAPCCRRTARSFLAGIEPASADLGVDCRRAVRASARPGRRGRIPSALLIARSNATQAITFE